MRVQLSRREVRPETASRPWCAGDVVFAVDILAIVEKYRPREQVLANGNVVRAAAKLPLAAISRRLDRLGLTPAGGKVPGFGVFYGCRLAILSSI